ncbi:hypothetical protein [Cupriavidus sp. RAF12]|uniref:hypothetical protein n=1 Tax=Cupriavidus sp. RAF12 TaxID=3233050 RepID=UPI003F9036AD
MINSANSIGSGHTSPQTGINQPGSKEAAISKLNRSDARPELKSAIMQVLDYRNSNEHDLSFERMGNLESLWS